MKNNRILRVFTFIMLSIGLLFVPLAPTRADVAPPDYPPGTNILPGDENTQVRMEAETVLMEVLERSGGTAIGQAKVTATFTMRNLGAVEERMQVRFPLTFWNGASNGYFEYPETWDLQVKVNGIPEGTTRVTTPNTYDEDGPDIPWAAFEVIFPPDQEVLIKVTYTQNAVGEMTIMALRYILETGAGWQGTIGSAELILRLPYEANLYNIIFEDQVGYGMTTEGGVLQGNELGWYREDFEPQGVDNLEVLLIVPSAWRNVLREQQNVEDDPGDGEAWGRLGKAYKEIIRYRRGLRTDPGGLELYQLSVQAYQECLRLLPQDSLWHFGYAELLWEHWAYHVQFSGVQDYHELVTALTSLQTALQIDPDNQKAKDLLLDISYWIPEYVQRTDGGFDLLILTATPLPYTATPTPEFSPSPTSTSGPTTTPASPPTHTLPPLAPTATATPEPSFEATSLSETRTAIYSKIATRAALEQASPTPKEGESLPTGLVMPCGCLSSIPLLGIVVALGRKRYLNRA